ncbi:MAG: rubrerythrin family protein [Lachnospiraceae bacterium]|nr:rubrerythrin family protein [Lachnospiraceae bacterium]
MEGKYLENICNFNGMKPIMVDLPYPPIRVRGRNQGYADLLSIDYCGGVSELSAITQYINNENRLSCQKCAMAKTLLGIAMAEMMHLQKLGELIGLLGGDIDFVAKACNGRGKMWTPAYLVLPEQTAKMLTADMKAEKAAIEQYKTHICMISDDYVNAVLARIIQDEEYHIMILEALMRENC